MAAIDTIKEVLQENLNIDPSTVSEDSTLESLNIDSLDMVELICELEDKEGIDFWRARRPHHCGRDCEARGVS